MKIYGTKKIEAHVHIFFFPFCMLFAYISLNSPPFIFTLSILTCLLLYSLISFAITFNLFLDFFNLFRSNFIFYTFIFFFSVYIFFPVYCFLKFLFIYPPFIFLILPSVVLIDLF